MTTPIIVQLTTGLTEGTSEVDAKKPGINYCENLDFSKVGEVSGRPGFVSHTGFGNRILDTVAGTTTDAGVTALGTISYDFSSMFKYRDSLGERPGLAANGRVWTWEGDRWADRLYCGSARVDRLADYFQYPSTLVSANTNTAVAYNYCQADLAAGGLPSRGAKGSPLLGGVNPTVENIQPGMTKFLSGGSCSVKHLSLGNTYHVTVGNTGVDTDAWFVVRKNNDHALTSVKLSAGGCEQNNGFNGNAPVCCTDDNASSVFGVPTVWAAYKNVAGNQVNFIRVNAITGALVAGPVAYALANVIGMCITSDSASNTLVATFTQTATKGIACRKFNATTLANVPASDVQFDPGAANNANYAVVCGWSPAKAVAFIAYGTNTTNDVTTVIGTYNPTGPVVVTLKTYGGTGSNTVWSPAHQPVKLKYANSGATAGHERMVMGLYFSARDTTSTGYPFSTWFSVDLTDLAKESGEVKLSGTGNPGLLAMGPVEGTLATGRALGPIVAPSCAIPGPNSESYRFSTFDFRQFSAAGGTDVALGVNEVVLISPRAASIGEETVISGSVPHAIARGYCFETVFSQVAPELTVTAVAGGTLAVGSYSLQAVWRWTDESGTVHRSAPSAITQTVSTAGANLTLRAVVQNLQLTNREIGDVYIELYSTDVAPTSSSPKTIRVVVAQGTGATTTLNWTTTLGGGYALYTNNGAILSNLPVSADGGVATVNRRMWVSDGKAVYASKKFSTGTNSGVAWNDDGPLTLKLPTPAGRILALEALDDKLIILCEHGIYMTQGDGPEDTGLGQDFLFPVMVSSLGVSNEVGSVATPRGIVFHVKNNTQANNQGYGGLYILTRGLNVEPIATNIQNELSIFQSGITGLVAELGVVAERDLLVCNIKANPNTHNFFVLDMRAGEPPGQWSVWTPPNADHAAGLVGGSLVGCAGVNGALWGLFGENGDFGTAAAGCFEGPPGFDAAFAVGDTTHSILQLLRTNHIYANGTDGLGWARVRAITTLSAPPIAAPQAYDETLAITQDETLLAPDSTGTATTFAVVLGGKWPSARPALEYRLPNQKCSQLQIQLTAIPAIARWSVLRLDTTPKNTKAPANNRR